MQKVGPRDNIELLYILLGVFILSFSGFQTRGLIPSKGSQTKSEGS